MRRPRPSSCIVTILAVIAVLFLGSQVTDVDATPVASNGTTSSPAGTGRGDSVRARREVAVPAAARSANRVSRFKTTTAYPPTTDVALGTAVSGAIGGTDLASSDTGPDRVDRSRAPPG